MSHKHIVAPGDCISSIAVRHGFAPDTIWSAPENAPLRDAGRDPNVLCPGDEVFVPDLRLGEASCATARRHRFRRRGVPEKLRLQLLDEGAPRAGLPYVLEIDALRFHGETDGEGKIERSIPPDARRGRLVLRPPGADDEVYDLLLGRMPPLADEDGPRVRLENLGYLNDRSEAVLDEAYHAAIAAFQGDHELEPTGDLDDVTRARIGAVHGY